eukprot:g55961.t1
MQRSRQQAFARCQTSAHKGSQQPQRSLVWLRVFGLLAQTRTLRTSSSEKVRQNEKKKLSRKHFSSAAHATESGGWGERFVSGWRREWAVERRMACGGVGERVLAL